MSKKTRTLKWSKWWATEEEYKILITHNPGFNMLRCKKCMNPGYLYRTPMHIGLYCSQCYAWMAFLKQNGLKKFLR